MKIHHTVACLAFACVAASISIAQTQPTSPSPSQPAGAQSPSVSERVAALKKSLAESKAKLKDFEWIETTTVFMKDEEKSSNQMRCSYGADGKVQKAPVTPPPEPDKPRGIRGRIVEKKKAELTGYMKQAVGLVHEYLPPDGERIQKAKDAGNVSIAVLEPGKRIRIDLKEYLKSGDELRVEMTLTDNRLAGIGVSTILDDAETKNQEHDPVGLEVRMGTLENGATYAEEITLLAEAKHLKVVVANSGYRKIE